MSELKYLAGYAPDITNRVKDLLDGNKLSEFLLNKYPAAHDLRNAQSLYDYAIGIKNEFLRNTKALSKVVYDDKLHVIHEALGLHTYVNRVQGSKIKAKNEIRISSVFKTVPLDFLRMILVHELAHLKEKDHNKAFYKLCEHMEPEYHQLEFDVRVYLTHVDLVGKLY